MKNAINSTIPVVHCCPVQPSTHVHVSGAVQFWLVLHPPLHIAKCSRWHFVSVVRIILTRAPLWNASMTRTTQSYWKISNITCRSWPCSAFKFDNHRNQINARISHAYSYTKLIPSTSSPVKSPTFITLRVICCPVGCCRSGHSLKAWISGTI